VSDKLKITPTIIEEIRVTTEVHLSLKDKIKVLLGWLPIVKELIHYDIEAGSATTKSSVYLRSPFPKKPPSGGYAGFEEISEDKTNG
jgi:hypothetical protein